MKTIVVSLLLLVGVAAGSNPPVTFNGEDMVGFTHSYTDRFGVDVEDITPTCVWENLNWENLNTTVCSAAITFGLVDANGKDTSSAGKLFVFGHIYNVSESDYKLLNISNSDEQPTNADVDALINSIKQHGHNSTLPVHEHTMHIVTIAPIPFKTTPNGLHHITVTFQPTEGHNITCDVQEDGLGYYGELHDKYVTSPNVPPICSENYSSSNGDNSLYNYYISRMDRP